MLHIYCGDGKGKTTAALGLALRAAGSGMAVLLVQLMKGGFTSELAALSRIPEITVRRCDRDYDFSFRMDTDERVQITACHNRLLTEAAEALRSGRADMVVLDEFFAAWSTELLDRRLAEQLVAACPETAELVLTGRNPEADFLELADYVSEMRAVKHPYEKGIAARKGIEY